MRVEVNGTPFELGATEATPTIGITDYSRRVTDDFGVTTVVERGFSRRLSVRLGIPMTSVDALQRRLADLRATSAIWVADSASEWLTVEGFYKDFSIDLASAALSDCTLTVEGLAQTEVVTDTGGDPAPVGMTSALQLLQPVTVTDAVLASSSSPETEQAEWSASTTYPKGARVLKAATHRVYESANGGNLNHDPAALTGEWIDIAPTNRWAMFDQALGTATTTPSPLVVALNVTAANAIALIDVVAETVRVQAAGYDKTRAATNGTVTFLDMPSITGVVTITVTGSGTVSVGTLLGGKVVKLGVTETSPSAGISDYSRKVVDDFGDVTVVQRAWAKRMTANALIRTSAIDLVANRIAAVRARPSLWIGEAGLDTLTIYGFFKDFSIERGENVSKLSLSIEGLSKAAPLPVPAPVYVLRGDYDPAVSYAAGNVVQFEGSSWFYTASEASTGNAPPALPQTENAFWKVFARAGLDGAPGDGGNSTFLHIAYANSANGSVDFTTGTPGLRTYLGIRVDGAQADSTNYADYNWSLIKGADGLNGSNGMPGAPGANGLPTYVHIAYANNATGTANFSVDDPTGRAYIGFYSDQTLADSTNHALYAWSLVKGADGLNGTNGAPGAPGVNGLASYFHTAFANSPTGSIDFTTGLPNGRAFIGTYSDFTPADSNDPNAYTWTAYKGPAAFGLIARGDVIVASNSLVKTVTSNAWGTGGGFSSEGYRGGAQTSFSFDTVGQIIAGLNTDPASNDSFDTIDYAILSFNGTAGIYESGASIASLGACSPTTRFQIVYDNRTVTYYKDGATVRQIAAVPDLLLYFDAAHANAAGDKLINIGFTAAGSAGSNGTPGVSPSVVSLNKAALTFAADSTGTIKPGQQPQFVQASYKTGSTDNTAAAAWSITSASSSASVSVDGAGKVTITNVTGAGEATVRGSFNGVTPQDQTFNWTRPMDSPPPAGATSLSTSPSGVVYATTTAFPANPTTTLTINSDASGQIRADLTLSYYADPTSGGALTPHSFTVAGYVGYRVAGTGGAYTGFSGGAVTGTQSSGPGYNIEPESEGLLALSQTQTGLSGNTSYEVCFFVRRSASLRSTFATFTSNFTVRQP